MCLVEGTFDAVTASINLRLNAKLHETRLDLHTNTLILDCCQSQQNIPQHVHTNASFNGICCAIIPTSCLDKYQSQL